MDRRGNSGRRFHSSNDTYNHEEILRARASLVADTKFGRMHYIQRSLRMDESFSNVWEGEEGMMEHQSLPFPMPKLLEEKPPVVVVNDSDDDESKAKQEKTKTLSNEQSEQQQADDQTIETEVPATVSNSAETVNDLSEAQPLATSMTSDDIFNSLQSTDDVKGIKRHIKDEDDEHPSFKKNLSNTAVQAHWQKILSISMKLEEIIPTLENYVLTELTTKRFSDVHMGLMKIKANINVLQRQFSKLNNKAKKKERYGKAIPGCLTKSNSLVSITDVFKRFFDAFKAVKRENEHLRTAKIGIPVYAQSKNCSSGSLDVVDVVQARIKEGQYWNKLQDIFRRLNGMENDIKQIYETKTEGKLFLADEQGKQITRLKKEIKTVGRKLNVKKVQSSKNGFPEMRDLPISKIALEKKIYVTSASQVHNFFSKVEKDFQNLLC